MYLPHANVVRKMYESYENIPKWALTHCMDKALSSTSMCSILDEISMSYAKKQIND